MTDSSATKQPTSTGENTAGEWYGHMTMKDGSHVRLTEGEAKALWDAVDRKTAERNAKYPTEKACIDALFDAFTRLKDFGWSEAIYCPKDGSIFDAIEAGSTGIHKCNYDGKWPDGHWWVYDDGDMWPSRPILYRSPAALPDSDQGK